MSEKTVEERAALEIAEYIDEAWLQVSHLTSKGRLAFIEVAATKSIRAAVAEQKERDAEVDPLSVECPMSGCIGSPEQRCTDPSSRAPVRSIGGFHSERWRAAIRKGTR